MNLKLEVLGFANSKYCVIIFAWILGTVPIAETLFVQHCGTVILSVCVTDWEVDRPGFRL